MNGRAKSKSFAAKAAPTGSVNIRRMGGAQRYPSQSPATLMVKTATLLLFNQQSHRRRQTPLSGGRAESLWKGLSGMDAARAAMGQGWPFAAGPWSNDGAREPDEVGPDARGKTFCLLLGRLPKVSRRKGGTGQQGNTNAAAVY